ncbi:MAG: dihydroneopterin aldolase [Cytophagaceae bacterium]
MQKLHTEICLEGLEFFAYHGYYPEEQKIGNRFLVDVKVSGRFTGSELSDLEKTVNYELIYAIVEKEMAIPTPLIETVALRILDQLFIQLKQIHEAEVGVSKLNPPIKGKCDRARVVLRRSAE